MYAFSLVLKQNKTRLVKYVPPCESKVKMQRKNASEATSTSLLPTSLIYIILITITLLAKL